MVWKYFILNSQGAHSEVKEFQLVETQHRRDDNPMKYATISSRMRYKTRFSIYTVDSRCFQCNACFSVCLQCLFRRQLIFFSMVIFMLMLRLSFNAPDSSISPTVAGCSRISNTFSSSYIDLFYVSGSLGGPGVERVNVQVPCLWESQSQTPWLPQTCGHLWSRGWHCQREITQRLPSQVRFSSWVSKLFLSVSDLEIIF